VMHERAQIARAVNGKPVGVRADEAAKIKHTDLYQAGPPATRAMRNKEQR
jgi:hypothetical protein